MFSFDRFLVFQTGDEWREHVEEEKKDYSGLKIQNLQITDDDNEKQKMKQESEEEVEIDDNGQTVVKKRPVGPWKVIQDQKVEESPPPGKRMRIDCKILSLRLCLCVVLIICSSVVHSKGRTA